MDASRDGFLGPGYSDRLLHVSVLFSDLVDSCDSSREVNSMGAFILGAGTKGKRFTLPMLRIPIPQPMGGHECADIKIWTSRSLIPYFVEMSEKHSPFNDLKVESCELSCDGVSQLLSVLSTLTGPLNSLSIGGNDLGRLLCLMYLRRCFIHCVER